MRLFIFLCFTAGVFFISCDTYLGYDYDAENPATTVRVFGNITNKYTGEAVDSAQVQLGLFQTLTDVYGDYAIYYELSISDQRDKPVPLSISATNYFPYSDQFILYQGTIEKTFELDYAAPMIDSAQITSDYTGLGCSAFISDYQGYSNIRNVTGTFFYDKYGHPKFKSIDIDMNYKRASSYKSAEFRCIVPRIIEEEWTLLAKARFFYIYVEDYDGFTDFRRFDK